MSCALFYPRNHEDNRTCGTTKLTKTTKKNYSFRRHRRDQGLDVPERKRESLRVVTIALDLRHMVRHHHPVVADLLVDAHRLQHVDVAIVNERFLKIEEASPDVPEMDVEDFLACAEVADDVENLFTR